MLFLPANVFIFFILIGAAATATMSPSFCSCIRLLSVFHLLFSFPTKSIYVLMRFSLTWHIIMHIFLCTTPKTPLVIVISMNLIIGFPIG